MSEPVPVFVLSGFLGSGKTTLLNQVLKSPAYANTAVIVNEFGEIGLDHLLIEQSTDNIVLLDSGCLCCTIADSLQETLADLNFRKLRGEIPAFERVIIETTGLADPAPILNTLLGNRLVTDHYRLDSIIITVDAQHALSGLEQHPEVAKQIAVADRLIITKLDLVDYPHELMARLRALNPGATMWEVRNANAALDAFAPGERHGVRGHANFDADAENHDSSHDISHDTDHNTDHDNTHGNSHASDHGTPHHSHNINRHDAHIRADAFLLTGDISWAGIAAWWQLVSTSFGDRLLRCKGLLKIADTGEIIFVQGVQRVFHRPERLTTWPGDDHRSRLVCITQNVDAAELRLTLRALELAPGTPQVITLEQLKQEGKQQ